MSLAARWNRYWFAPAPYFDLAVVRILLVSLQCYLLLSAVYGSLHYITGLPDDMFRPIPALKTLMWPWGWGAQPTADAVFLVFWATFAAGILALVGLLTRISLFIFAMGCIFTQAYIYSFGDMHHPEAVMMVALLALALAPSGKVLSVDSLLAGRFAGGPRTGLLDYYGTFAGWPLRLMQWFVPLMYLSAVSSKLSASGLGWANGYTLQYYLIQDGMRWGSELALWASQFHYPVLLAQWGVLVFQATFVLILFFPKLKWIYLPLGLGMHIGIYLMLSAPFPQWIAMYAVYIPWADAVRWLASAHVPGRRELKEATDAASGDAGLVLVYDGECPVCRAYVRFLKLRQAVGAVTLVDARQGGSIVDDLRREGVDLDEGMALIYGDRVYHGSDCLHMLALLSSESGVFNRVNAVLFRSRPVARAAYPVLRGGRNLLLRLLGRSKLRDVLAPSGSPTA